MTVKQWMWGAVLASFVCCADAQVANEGVVQAVSPRIVASNIPDAADLLWEKEVFERPGVTFFRIHFNEIRKGEARDVSIVIRNLSNKVIATLPVQEFAASDTFWTGILPGGYGLVQLVKTTRDGTARGLSFAVHEVALEARGARLYSQVDPNNPKDRPLVHYMADKPLMAAARSVAKLVFARDGRQQSCTGFMVAPDLMVTNEHCISTKSVCSSAYAYFGYQYDEHAVLHPGEEHRCVEVLDSDVGLDYALLRIAGAPGAPNKWGVMRWRQQPPREGEPLTLIQHPDGLPKRVARDGCGVTTLDANGKAPSVMTDFGHKCDTMSGSSGSPVIDGNNQVVGVHHLGYDSADSRWIFENRAVKAQAILGRIDKFRLGAP